MKKQPKWVRGRPNVSYWTLARSPEPGVRSLVGLGDWTNWLDGVLPNMDGTERWRGKGMPTPRISTEPIESTLAWATYLNTLTPSELRHLDEARTNKRGTNVRTDDQTKLRNEGVQEQAHLNESIMSGVPVSRRHEGDDRDDNEEEVYEEGGFTIEEEGCA